MTLLMFFSSTKSLFFSVVVTALDASSLSSGVRRSICINYSWIISMQRFMKRSSNS